MTRVLAAGVGLTLAATGALVLWQGPVALVPVLVMGVVATGIEVVAARALQRGMAGRGTAEFFKGVGVGMALRMAGIFVFLGLVLWNRTLFPPLPTGLGYVAVVIPLLFLEVRLAR